LPEDLWRAAIHSDVYILLLIAVIRVLLCALLDGKHGSHRDQLLAYINARHLALGYIPYPPVIAFLARIELEVFATSLRGFRFFSAVAKA
jgi:hypothetical protein